MRIVRGCTGLLAGGLVAMLLALSLAWLIAAGHDAPGPGLGRIGGHLVAAVVAVAAQRYADRHPGVRGLLGSAVVLLTTVLLLALAWIV
ncbi:hypothetical protein SAMN05443637_11490 [Pseudonocardia thermophila]|uniref:Uncharacterized protein n=1 Tax=Pseudonocardia thermophila TaxID=1848 RepID=A0A1M6WCH8_PSETH|nr:hypothetical protein [Pseudonocardia thermophila]SHK91358.1 hypothetical protein SAMN05443637_11490 [Pseudonocardia thermophila]